MSITASGSRVRRAGRSSPTSQGRKGRAMPAANPGASLKARLESYAAPARSSARTLSWYRNRR